MKRNKKKRRLIFLIIVSIWLTFFLTDATLTIFKKKPIFSIPLFHAKDGGSTGYVGLFYNVYTVKKIAEPKTYIITREDGSTVDIYYCIDEIRYNVITPWFVSLDFASRNSRKHYLEYDLSIYESLEFNKKMIKGYTLINDYTTDTEKRYVHMINGYETNDYIIVYNDEEGNITAYYKSKYIYVKDYFKPFKRNSELDYFENVNEIIKDKIMMDDTLYTYTGNYRKYCMNTFVGEEFYDGCSFSPIAVCEYEYNGDVIQVYYDVYKNEILSNDLINKLDLLID